MRVTFRRVWSRRISTQNKLASWVAMKRLKEGTLINCRPRSCLESVHSPATRRVRDNPPPHGHSDRDSVGLTCWRSTRRASTCLIVRGSVEGSISMQSRIFFFAHGECNKCSVCCRVSCTCGEESVMHAQSYSLYLVQVSGKQTKERMLHLIHFDDVAHET